MPNFSSADILQEQERLSSLVSEVRSGLVHGLDSSGVLVDACQNASTPVDHYAPVFLALALQVAGEPVPANRLLEHWAGVPGKRRGHEPFNRLGLGLIDSLEGMADHPVVDARRALCPLRRRYPSNNWSLLAQALRVREAAGPVAVRRQQRRMLGMTRRWTTAAGGFIDFPARPDPERGIATPIAYHLKYLLCLHIALSRAPHPELEAALLRGLDWLRLFLTDGGYCGGFGRSNHALFGDACLLAVLHGLLRRPDGLGPDAAAEVLRVARNVRQRLERQRREDGLLWLTPGGGCGEAAGWDGYMFLSVYNAWFAGLLSATLNGHPWLTGASLPDWAPGWTAPPGIHEDREAGLLRFRGERVDAQISTGGQAIQGFGRSITDLRQAALCPFHVEVDGRPVVAPPPRVGKDALVNRPAVAGWTPIVEAAGGLFGMTRLGSVTVESRASGVALTGSGAPRRLTRPPERTWRDRLRATLDWRLLGGHLGRQQGVRPPSLPGCRWEALLEIDDAAASFRCQLFLQPIAVNDPPRWLNPAGSARLAASRSTGGGSRAATLGVADCRSERPEPWPAPGATRNWEVELEPAGSEKDGPKGP